MRIFLRQLINIMSICALQQKYNFSIDAAENGLYFWCSYCS